jgi:hypothetical protein
VHTFTHLPFLDQKRTPVSALELDGGQVLITGNWYAPDHYRVRHAQELMQQNPDLPLHAVAEESGFPNETTFLRNFKVQTGITPSEWKASL